jgi:AraC-like DNA-binding protein
MYNLPNIKILLEDSSNAILYKKLDTDMLDMEKIIVSHSIVYVKSGKVIINTFDYKSYTVTDGEMLFMPKDSYLISDYLKESKSMEVYLFFFDYNIVSEFLKNVRLTNKSSKTSPFQIRISSNIMNFIHSFEGICYKDNNKHLLKIKLLELLHLVYEENSEFADILMLQGKVKDIKEYMLAHYDKNLSINDWAKLSGYSLSTFTRKFKKENGISPKSWILEQNMKLAAKALMEGVPVSKCASVFGYKNSSNFIKAFKEFYNTTPKQYSMT